MIANSYKKRSKQKVDGLFKGMFMKKIICKGLLAVLLLNSSISYSGVDGKAFEDLVKFLIVGTAVVAAGTAGAVCYYLGSNKETPDQELKRLKAQDKQNKERINEIIKQNPHLNKYYNNHDSKL